MKYLIQSNYFIAICAFVLTMCTYLVFKAYSVEALYYSLAVLFGTQTIYSFLRFGENIKNPKERALLLRNESAPILLSVVFLWLSNIGVEYLACLLLSLGVSLLYGAHIFSRFRKISLRNNALLKLTSIGLVWAVVTSIIPFFSIDLLTTKSLLYAMLIFLMIVFLTIPFELNDYDEKQEPRTIVHLYGVDVVKKIARVIVFTSWFIAGFISVPVFLSMSGIAIIYLKLLHQNIRLFHIEKTTIYFDGIIIAFVFFIIILQLFVA